MNIFKNVLSIICYLLYLAIPLMCFYFLRDNFLVMISFMISFLMSLFFLYIKDNYYKKLNLHSPFDFLYVFFISWILSKFNLSIALDITTGFCLASLIPLVFTLIGIHLFFLIKYKDPFHFMKKEFLLDPRNEKLIATIRKQLPEGFFDHITNRK